MNERQEKEIKKELLNFFRKKFTYLGMTDEMKESRVYALVDEMFSIINKSINPGPEKLPTHLD